MTSTQTEHDLRATAVLAVFAREHPTAVGFAYTPVAAPWFTLDPDGAARDADGRALDLSAVFELRAFDSAGELRWWNVPGEGGHTRVITDDDLNARGLTRGDAYRRLLWGQVRRPAGTAGGPDGWVTLFEARIGPLWVPVSEPVEDSGRVALEAVEYLREDEHGNVTVVDERLTRLTEMRSDSRA